MILYDLIKTVKIKCSKVNLNTEIKGIASDSRKIKSGYAFVAINGDKRDGNDYIEEAIKNGASVIVTDNKNLYCNFPTVHVENARESLSLMWNEYYENPTKNMKIIAITGTNGKTSCAYLLYSILRKARKKCGLISTIECLINDKNHKIEKKGAVSDIYAEMTTPDPEVLYSIFNVMKNDGVEYVVMEASSHSISQKRLAGVEIYLSAFTNLSREHLDYHKNMENYYNSKKELLANSQIGIVNIDDEFGKKLINEIPRLYTSSTKTKADFCAENIEFSNTGCSFLAKSKDNTIEIVSNLLGNFVPENIMIAFALANLLEIPYDSIKEGILSCNQIKGRMEMIENSIIIDYAHTEEAMKNTILSIKKHNPHKLITVVFGCGGDRDKSKRSQMGRIASDYCDKIILTSDNSRSEKTEDIINEIKSGISSQAECYVIEDRKKAIEFAVKTKQENEILLLLGKGHENYEINRNGKSYFNEREIVKEALKNVQNKNDESV